MCMKDKIKQFFTFKAKKPKWKIKNGVLTVSYKCSPLAKILADYGVHVPPNLDEEINDKIRKELGL